MEGPQVRCSSVQGDLPSQERRSRPEGLGGVRDKLGQRYPAIAQSWQRNWEHVVPFFAYAESVRRIIYTTDEIDKSFSVARFSPAIDANSDAQLSSTGRVRTNRPPLADAGPAPTATATQPWPLFP